MRKLQVLVPSCHRPEPSIKLFRKKLSFKHAAFEPFPLKPKLFINELWGLGDLVIATPFLRAASEKFDVTLLAKP